jgi:hypothetical protein
MDEPRHPVGPEIDDSSNPTAASPEPSTSQADEPALAEPPPEGGKRPISGRDMLTQLQAMIDSLTVQATPVVRDVAAKAAELAAIAGEKAGPLAHRAADATEKVGVRVAARSKEMAADLRRPRTEESEGTAGSAHMSESRMASDEGAGAWTAEPPATENEKAGG